MKIRYFVAFFAIAYGLSMSVALADKEDRPDRRQHEERAEQKQQDRFIRSEQRVDNEPRRQSNERGNQIDQGRRSNHLSADERRALRQQINEAGQDIYSRRR